MAKDWCYKSCQDTVVVVVVVVVVAVVVVVVVVVVEAVLGQRVMLQLSQSGTSLKSSSSPYLYWT